MSREVAPIYSFFGQDYYFQDLIVDGISSVVFSDGGERNNFIIGVDKEEDMLNSLNSNSLFSQKTIVIVKNSKKIKPKFKTCGKFRCRFSS